MRRRFRMPENRWARIGLVVLNVAIFLGIWEIVAEQEWINRCSSRPRRPRTTR